MSFEASLKTHLSVAVVAAFTGDRIYPDILPQGDNTLPAVTYSLIDGQPQNSIDGFTSGLSRCLVQIDCWALTRNAANALALTIRDRMNVAASSFQSVITNFPLLDDYEEDTKRYRRSIGCSCWFSE